MNKNAKLILFSVILAAYCASSLAESGPIQMPNLTTASLNPVCSQLLEGTVQEKGFNQGLCVGIILGVEDNAYYDKKICISKNIGIKERVQVIRDYIATKPKRMNEAFASLVFDAMAEKWPCKN
jgi:hypothetical protein